MWIATVDIPICLSFPCELSILPPPEMIIIRRFSTAAAPNKDAYFSLIHHVSHVLRRDIYPEKTLNRLGLPVSPDLVFRVLRALSSSQDPAPPSLRFFEWARTHPSYSPTPLEFEELLKTLARSRRYSSMWALLSPPHRPRPSLSPETLGFLIEQYGKHGLTDQAVQLFNRSKTLSCEQTVNLYNSLVFALCEGKLFHAAYALIRRMVRKGVRPDRKTYSLLVSAWCSNGKFREAQEFLREMSEKGFNPSVRGRDVLVEGLLNAGYLEAAKGMVRRMTKEGVVPDVATFNSLVQAACNAGDVDFAVEVYGWVCELGLCVDVNSYCILIPAVSKAGKIDVAMRLLGDAVDDGIRPFPSLYAPVIKGMCRQGMFDDAFCFFGEMKAKGHPPNRPVYTMLITMCGRGGRFIEAANYLVEMTEMGLRPITRCFDLVVDGLKNCGKHDIARRIEQLEVSLTQI